MAIKPQDMPSQAPEERRHNMREVALGYTEEMAKTEASRCLGCKGAPCVDGCPVKIRIPEFLAKAAEGDFDGAIGVIRESSLLPGICGRVCPQEKQCQANCTLGKALKDVNKAVAIGRVERFCADLQRESGKQKPAGVKPATGKKVAIIGSGPAGITVAADVRREGHDVTVFEAFHKPGGVLVNFDADYARDMASHANLPENHAHKDLPDWMTKENEIITMEIGITQQPRPQWDVQLLAEAGFERIQVDLGVYRRIYAEIDEFYNPTPIFTIAAYK